MQLIYIVAHFKSRFHHVASRYRRTSQIDYRRPLREIL